MMKYTIKKSTILLGCYAIYLMLTLINITKYYNRLIIWWAFLAVMIVITLLQEKTEAFIIKNRCERVFFGFLLMQGILWTVFSISSTLFDYAIEYARIYIPYILCMWFTVRQFTYYDMIDEYIDVSYFCIACYMICSYATHFNGLEALQWLTQIFERYDRYRVTYGFSSPDIAACQALCVIVCSMLKWKRASNPLKFIMVAVDFIMVIMIISTGCRSQFIALLLIVGMKIYYWIVKEADAFVKTDKQALLLKSIRVILILCGICIVAGEYFQTTNLQEALINSNRMGLFEIDIPLLIKKEKIWAGLAYASAGRFGEGRIGDYYLYYVDNYYVYMLMSSGVLGLGMHGTAILKVIKSIKVLPDSIRNQREILMIVVTINLVMGLFSCAVIYPNYIHCTLFWALPIMYVCRYERTEEENEQLYY